MASKASHDDALFRMLDLGLPDELPEQVWHALGFRDPARVREGFARLRARVDVARAVDLGFGDILRALARTCAPDQAFSGLERWLEAGGAAMGASPADWSEEPFLGLLCNLCAATPALTEYLIRLPQRTRPVLQAALAPGRGKRHDWRAQVRSAVYAQETHPQRLACLRRARTEAMLQIAARDLSGAWTLEKTVWTLSDLADACIETALACAVEHLRPRHGEAAPLCAEAPAHLAQAGFAPPPPFVVLAMGKLGGRELNYSSDIDLLFAYSGDGKTQGSSRALDYAGYFTRLGEELIAALNQVTAEGRVFRVDMRLRPYGASGPLVLSVAETLAYLQAEGRTWERQAWLKARAVAGDLSLGDALLLEAAPFVYRRFLSLDAIGDIQALKRQIELSVARRGESGDEVKLGRGGLRDIEFTVQFLQLLHGGQHPDVRGGETLRALRSLRRQGLLTPPETERLEEAYLFWRAVEHRLQLHGDRQTHTLPADPATRRRVARSLGYRDLPLHPQTAISNSQTAEALFESDRLRHVTRVREIFEGLFANLFPEQHGPEGHLSEILLAPQPDLEVLARLLPEFGFAAAPESARELVALSRERVPLTNPSRTRKFFASLAPLLLKALAATGEPEASLKRFSRLAGSLGGKAVFYQALHEHPWLLKMTAELAAWSEYLTEILVANPGLFDELVDALRTDRSKTREEMQADLQPIVQAGDVSDTLRAYRAGELLRIGVRDLIHSAPLEQTQRELSALAAALLDAQLAQTLRDFQAQRGEVRAEDGRPVGFAILGVGKLGGQEMNFGSDLDVLFFYGEEGQTEQGLPAASYFAELVQELIRSMAKPTTLGSLYQLDARLRPNGNKGPLASSLAAFERYWKEGSLADWERLALTRARFVSGDRGVGERAEHLIRSAVYSPLRSTTLAAEVRAMRKRMEETAEGGDVKRGRGGIVDLEFLVQFLQLVHGPAFPPLRQPNTKEALLALLKHKRIPEADGGVLLEAYDFLCRMANRVRIVHGLSANKLPSKPEELQKLALRALYLDAPGVTAGEQLSADYRKYTDGVREIFERIVAL